MAPQYLSIRMEDSRVAEAFDSAFQGRKRVTIQTLRTTLVDRLNFNPSRIVELDKNQTSQGCSGSDHRLYPIKSGTIHKDRYCYLKKSQ